MPFYTVQASNIVRQIHGVATVSYIYISILVFWWDIFDGNALLLSFYLYNFEPQDNERVTLRALRNLQHGERRLIVREHWAIAFPPPYATTELVVL